MLPNALSAAETRPAPPGLINCQSHLFFPEVLDMMRKRKTEPLVYDQEGTTFSKRSWGIPRKLRPDRQPPRH
jgi:hypothetical protein